MKMKMKRKTKSLRNKFDPLQVKFHPLSSSNTRKIHNHRRSSILHSSNSQNPSHKSPSHPNSISLHLLFSFFFVNSPFSSLRFFFLLWEKGLILRSEEPRRHRRWVSAARSRPRRRKRGTRRAKRGKKRTPSLSITGLTTAPTPTAPSSPF